jgi:kinetochore protein Mis12/MTW1
VHLKRTKHKRSTELRRAKKLFEALSSYEAAIDASKTMPDRLMAMHKSVSTLPELSPATVTMLSEFQHTEAGKRKWETGKLGYVNWAIAQLLAKSAEAGGGELLPDIANTEMYRKACEVMDGVSKNLEAAEETDDPMGS